MGIFITNQGHITLKKRIIELIQASEELKFLVGFFYFSGIQELYQGLKNNPDVTLKVLVGLDVDRNNLGLIEYAHSQKNISDEERIKLFLDSIKKSINSQDFDNREFYNQVNFFINLIKNNRLIIRKTVDPNHAKVYIFKLNSKIIPHLFITGSSNLTKAGLVGPQNEFNIEISDFGFEEADKYFDQLWEEAIPVTEALDIKKQLIQTVSHKTLLRNISPFEAFVLVLHHYLNTYQHKPVSQSLTDLFRKNGYKPYQYQLDAIQQALSIIEKNNGVILADVVGLGKTVIACSIARELRKRGVIICPPGLKGDPKMKDGGWNMYKEQFGLFDWEVWSLGELDKLQEAMKKMDDIEIIIIDEAHRFRNEDTQSYEYLKNICRNKIVILLTATPFNNRPTDIFALLKLFTTPKQSSLILDNNLFLKFQHLNSQFTKLAYINKYHDSPNTNTKKRALSYYRKLFKEDHIDYHKINQRAQYLAQQIRDVIEPVTIRRNRLDLQNNPRYQNEIKDLSSVADPQEWFFQLTYKQSKFYDQIISYFSDPEEGGVFKGAIYRPFDYERGNINFDSLNLEENREYIIQRNLYDFMRRLLVKRFESSFGAFYKSIKNFQHITKVAYQFVNKTNKFILARKLMENIYEKNVDEIDKELEKYVQTLKTNKNLNPRKYKIYDLNKKEFRLKKQFLNDIQSDLKLFNSILQQLKKFKLVENDPKIASLIQNIKEKALQSNKKPKRKVIIFSEYADTVNYLTPKLQQAFQDRVLVVNGALTKKMIDDINKNFDASYSKQKDDYDILLTTDKLSEGFNLNRAGMVINYDIPWNPVRVIQRLGRINRINKKVFDELYLVNFFPTEKGADLVKSRETAANKMFLIHNVLGEDAKIFDVDKEHPTPAKLYQKLTQNPEKLEEMSFFTKVLSLYQSIKKQYPHIVDKLTSVPPRVKTAKKFSDNELLVFVKKNRLHVYRAKYNNGKIKIDISSLEEVLNHIKCHPTEPTLHWNTDEFWQLYKQVQDFEETQQQTPTSTQSLESKALNNLNYLLDQIPKRPIDKLKSFLSFLRTLREDILDYGTLATYTLRRIKNLSIDSDEDINNTLDDLNKLIIYLGGKDYLEKEKQRINNLDKEIIVAIENKA